MNANGSRQTCLSMHVLLCAGLFVYGYCLYYYTARSDMSGFMQGSFFFGYMAIVCFGFFLMLGTVGWRASLMFVRHIYKVTPGFAVLLEALCLSTADSMLLCAQANSTDLHCLVLMLCCKAVCCKILLVRSIQFAAEVM